MNPLQEEILRAKLFCVNAHAGQFRRDGSTPYHTHPFAVADAVPDELKPAAYLHDVMEDCGVSVHALSLAGISARTILIVERLTRVPGESYDDYLLNVLGCPDAIRIKIADMEHNLSCDPSENSKAKIAKWLPVLKAAVSGGVA